jgi:TolA-binding protein
MKQELINTNRKFARFNRNIWLIITSIVSIITISGCGSTPQGLRQNLQPHASNLLIKGSNNQLLAENNDNTPKIEKPTIPASNNTSVQKKNESEPKKMIPLNEQVKNLQAEQEIVKSDVNVLKNEVEELKSTLKDVMKTVNGGKPETAITGEPSSKDKNTDATPAQTVNKKPGTGRTILPDEQVAKPEQTKKTATPKKQTELRIKKAKKIVSAKNTLPLEKKVKEAKVQPPPQQNTAQATKQNQPATASKPVKDPELSSALEKIKNKDFSSAVDELTSLIQKEKKPDQLATYQYWLGESYFGLKDYNKALQHYNTVLKTPGSTMKDEAQAMTAEILIRSGQVAEAKKAYQALIDKYPGSQFIPRAKKMLQQL